jgi:predicted RNase H-like nuclease (RuvC/YqgF family)
MKLTRHRRLKEEEERSDLQKEMERQRLILEQQRKERIAREEAEEREFSEKMSRLAQLRTKLSDKHKEAPKVTVNFDEISRTFPQVGRWLADNNIKEIGDKLISHGEISHYDVIF